RSYRQLTPSASACKLIKPGGVRVASTTVLTDAAQAGRESKVLMEKRRGASISVKMIATSTILILLVVALFGILNIVNTSRVFEEQAQRQRDSVLQSLQKRGATQTRDLAQASQNAILGADWKTLANFVPKIAQEDTEIAYLYVADKDGIAL